MPRSMLMSRVARRAVLATSVITALAAQAAGAADIPDQFRNLKVLPGDIEKGELVSVMRGYAGALGVRCTHCHVGKEDQPLSTYDFASDEKTPKRVARDMMRMVDVINRKYIAKVDTGRPEKLTVTCATCHHGLDRPQQLKEVLIRLVDQKGLDATVQEYQQLRKKYYGGDQYDFGVGPLNMLAEHLADGGKLGDAVKAAELNAELHPDVTFVHSMLGDLYARAGDRTKAIEAMKKSLEVDPNNSWARKRLDELEKEKTP